MEDGIMTYVGVDWAAATHYAYALDTDGRKLGHKPFPHSGEGLTELVEWIRSVSGREPGRIAIGIEVPHGPVSLGDAAAQIEAKGFITVSEPAAGAGGMVLAMADALERQGRDPARHVWVEAVELSRSTFHMAYIQIASRGIAGRIIHGNSLTMEIYDQAFTPAARLFHASNGHPFAQQMAEVREAEAAESARQARRRELLNWGAPATARVVWT